jgi:hypothetical protein
VARGDGLDGQAGVRSFHPAGTVLPGSHTGGPRARRQLRPGAVADLPSMVRAREFPGGPAVSRPAPRRIAISRSRARGLTDDPIAVVRRTRSRATPGDQAKCATHRADHQFGFIGAQAHSRHQDAHRPLVPLNQFHRQFFVAVSACHDRPGARTISVQRNENSDQDPALCPNLQPERAPERIVAEPSRRHGPQARH